MQQLLTRQWFIVCITVATFALVALASHRITLLEQERAEQQQRTLVLNQAATLRARLEGELNSTLHLTRGLIAYVATHPDISEDEFVRMAREIITGSGMIRNIALAPDNVIRFIYPLSGNERALGLNYMQTPNQREPVLRAIETGQTVVAGPIELVQGGMGLINRSPIYTSRDITTAPRSHHYWGLASVVIDIPALFITVGLTGEVDGIRYALRGKDGLGEKGAQFFGDADLFDQDAVLLPINLPGGSWQMAALPNAGWHSQSSRLELYRYAGLLLALLLAALVYRVLSGRRQIEYMALHDHLTGMPNRRLFELRLEHALAQAQRTPHALAALYLDLDGFKAINDRYGHRIGDRVLRQIGWRLHDALRRSDTIARIGGDEYLILLEEIANAAEAAAVADKLIATVSAPLDIDGHPMQLSASIGISIYPESGNDAEQLVSRADDAMYLAKDAGKNCYRLDVQATGASAPPASDSVPASR